MSHFAKVTDGIVTQVIVAEPEFFDTFVDNSPGQASQRVTTTYAVASTTSVFTPSSGYALGYLDVFLNGVKLVNGDDYTATNGTTFTLTSAAVSGDVVEAVSYIPRGLSDGYTKAEADAKYPVKPTGTPNGSKFLRDDNSWQTVTAPSPTAVSDQANTSTGYFDLPSGTTAQRPASPSAGMIRHNTTNGQPEWYDAVNGVWINFGNRPSYPAEILTVAGGGGGGGRVGSGGGAGGLIYYGSETPKTPNGSAQTVTPGVAYSVVVGAGGVGGFGGIDGTESNGYQGNSSQFGGMTAAIGGGYGVRGEVGAGGSGGSGGGAGYDYTNSALGSGTSGQGNSGGYSSAYGSSYPYVKAGGGGAGGAGGSGNGSTGYAGNGGVGLQYSISGTATYYAGGGGGGTHNPAVSACSGGNGGGGNAGASGGKNSGSNGSAGTGGGGGGASTDGSTSYKGGNGGSGIVIIKYLGNPQASGGSVTQSGGYTIHTFTTSGTFTA